MLLKSICGFTGMSRRRNSYDSSRRAFLARMAWAPVAFLPATFSLLEFFQGTMQASPQHRPLQLPFADSRVIPRYPAKSPLDDILAKIVPGTDEYSTEKYAFEIVSLLNVWAEELKKSPPALGYVAKLFHPSINGFNPNSFTETKVRGGNGLQITKRHFKNDGSIDQGRFLAEFKTYLSSISRFETAEFQITGITENTASQNIECEIRYEFVGTSARDTREQRSGYWQTNWQHDDSTGWRLSSWKGTEETICRASGSVFVDVTSSAVGNIDSYHQQMLRGADYWRTVLDGACGVDVYGNNGVATGDFDNDGFDDIYVCQPAGLPNRLYRNRGDGTFEDVTQSSGVGVLDSTACALFADFENKGLQDLLVVCGNGPLLFVNQGNGKFALKRDAFKFTAPPQGTFTHAAIADYDRDGRLDVYFCLYSYYLGLDQYHYPAPYFDARNGPPNFLFHNEGNATFVDRTQASGLNVENDRYSFSCAWGDCNSDGWPDLYVANDFGRNNLYRNRGDGTFIAASAEAGAQDPGAGMSACWLDFNNDGNQDIYVADMWSAAGLRVSSQSRFHENDPAPIREFYRQHARGNSLYQNSGHGTFSNAGATAAVEMGRWAWSSDSWDFDHDGYPDLYVANGYISGPDPRDLSSFFWRQVVAQSPRDAMPSQNYERGWNAINEAVRSDYSWSGPERNVFYANNRDGTFSDVSGAIGLDFSEDSRAFALADLDHDGRLEIILKNRNAPQIRILHNAIKEIGNYIAFKLRGVKSNRDGIGTAITIEYAGHRQTKYLQAGSGFLSQHTKELFFGVGDLQGMLSATVRWPSGLSQTFDRLPVNHRVEIDEGSPTFRAEASADSPAIYSKASQPPQIEPVPSSIETWLVEPVIAPELSLPDVNGQILELHPSGKQNLLLVFWQTVSDPSKQLLHLLQRSQTKFSSQGINILSINVDPSGDTPSLRSFLKAQGISLPTAIASDEVTGIYNLVYRYLFDRRQNMAVPTSFLINGESKIIKVYQGAINPDGVIKDSQSKTGSPDDLTRRALPFEGTLYQSTLQRNDFTYGVAFFQHGYLDQAASWFKQVIAEKPDDPEAYYNLGTLYLRRKSFPEARQYLRQTVKLRPQYAEAWNNLGMLDAEEGHPDDAIVNLRRSLELKPDYVVALVNLGNVYRQQKLFPEAETALKRALAIEPKDAEISYSLGMLYARQNQPDRAEQYLGQAATLNPDYADAINNLGVLLVRERRLPEAEEKFEACIRVAPDFDQAYLNLARLYMILDDTEKAKAVLRALLQRQPENQGARQELDELH
jgi:tetratricopeptide (TPR) repeat protein/peroxiredoxin